MTKLANYHVKVAVNYSPLLVNVGHTHQQRSLRQWRVPQTSQHALHQSWLEKNKHEEEALTLSLMEMTMNLENVSHY